LLSRTADHLFWMARYIERAENMARVLDVTHDMSLVPDAAASEADLWIPALEMSGNKDIYDEDYDSYSASDVIHFLSMDEGNPSSIYNCLRNARENARAVRVALTSETWENINALWLEFRQFPKNNLAQTGLHEFCDWVKSRSHLFRGVSFGTMLRDDAFRFVRLGGFLERADNTARLLDVKYHLLNPDDNHSTVDYYEWSAVLRSVSAFQAYQKVFSDAIQPSRVAELLMLREDMPRSLHACYADITGILDQLAGGRKNECRRLAGEIHASLRFGRMDDIFKDGLHEFLTDFIVSNNQLGIEIHRHYLSVAA
jgi:uncharacterized alpha-E superfamily protein